MPAKLGTADVSFRLGSTTPAAVYLGATEVWTAAVPPRTLYFTGAGGNGDWSSLDNWFDDADGLVPASSLPTASDSVIVAGSIYANSGSEPTVVDFAAVGVTFEGSVTVTGVATFSLGATNDGTINGDAVFNDTSVNAGTVTGTATFNDDSCNADGTAGTFVPDPPPAC